LSAGRLARLKRLAAGIDGYDVAREVVGTNWYWWYRIGV
jgi:hypothetical protein